MFNRLAIIIPAFKGLFFRETLRSIANQTNKQFNLYISNDNSEEDLHSIIKEFSDQINIVYKKFDNNLGQNNLVAHWNRSVELCQNEDWVWLFSDDDLMPEDAVERFIQFTDVNPAVELLRFNTKIIDKDSQIWRHGSLHPHHETALNFLNRRFKGETYSFVVEYIFKRDLYKRKGGFINFPAGWASDDATWALFGKENGIFTIPGKPILWRLSGTNISSDTQKFASKKIIASIEFIKFIKTQNFKISVSDQVKWLLKQVRMLKPGVRLQLHFIKKIILERNISFRFKFTVLRKQFLN